MGRLRSATVKGKTETYKYDAFGNLTEKGIIGETRVMAVDAGSELAAHVESLRRHLGRKNGRRAKKSRT